MNRNDLFDRYGIWLRKPLDPLRLGRSRKRRRIATTSVAVGALMLTLVQEKASAHVGQQMVRTYVEQRSREDSFWKAKLVLSLTVFLVSGTGGTTQVTFPGIQSGAQNSVDCIGGGGNGGNALFCNCFQYCGDGAGGGGWSRATNVILGPTFSYAIGSSGGGTTSFNGLVSAGGGSNGSYTAAGGGGGGTHSGGGGGTGGTSTTGSPSGGGGGAAGPNGNGVTASGSTGGAGDAGAGGAGGGGAGNEFGSGVGSGGGASGVNFNTGGAGNPGGSYGGGGSGGANGSVGGRGYQGVIVVTYTPGSATQFNMAMLGI